MSDFIELYWDEYGVEGINYHVYMNDELIETTSTNHVSLRGLNPDTVYHLRVTAVNRDEEIEAFADVKHLWLWCPPFLSIDVTVNRIIRDLPLTDNYLP